MDERGQSTATTSAGAKNATVNDRMVRGAFWMVLSRILDRSLGFISMIVLARLLMPADFGLVAMATAVVAILEVIKSFGFDVALIQNASATRDHYDTAFTCNVILGLLIACVLVALSVPAASFYGQPNVTRVMLCLAIVAAVSGFENVGVVAFRKEMQFNKDFNLFLANRIIAFAVTIPLAFILRNYWALVLGTLIGRTVFVTLTYVAHPFRPRFSLAQRGAFFHFGKWLVTSTVVNLLATRSSDFLIGKASGAYALGVYAVSYEIANLPTTDLVAPINRAMLPGYANKVGHSGLLAASYLEVIGLVSLAVAPAAFGIAAVANLMVPVVLGARWLEAGPVIATLAFFGMLLALKSNNHYVYLALGKPRMTTLVGCIQVTLLLPMLAWGAFTGGALGAALGCVTAEILFTPISMALVRRELKIGYRALYSPFFRPLVAGAAMYVVVRLFEARVVPASNVPEILALVSSVAVGALVYPAVILALWVAAGKPASAERHVLEFARTQLWARLRDWRFVHR